jgi:DNA-binding MarR family transcriptional regulator
VAGDRNAFVQQVREDSNSDVGILITLMFRYAKTYIKKALQDSPIQTADEFAFLITLMTFDSLTKTELINKQVMEKTSGTEVIKRLAAQGMIREFADASDKRSIRVVISDKGRIEIIRILPEMAKVSQIVVGNLSDAEIKTLSYLLKKLDFFHNDIFMNKRHLGLDDIMQEKAI